MGRLQAIAEAAVDSNPPPDHCLQPGASRHSQPGQHVCATDRGDGRRRLDPAFARLPGQQHALSKPGRPLQPEFRQRHLPAEGLQLRPALLLQPAPGQLDQRAAEQPGLAALVRGGGVSALVRILPAQRPAADRRRLRPARDPFEPGPFRRRRGSREQQRDVRNLPDFTSGDTAQIAHACYGFLPSKGLQILSVNQQNGQLDVLGNEEASSSNLTSRCEWTTSNPAVVDFIPSSDPDGSTSSITAAARPP